VKNVKVGFGIQLPTWANFSYAENIEYAQLAEDAGFDYICVPDHFFLRVEQYQSWKVTYEKADPTRPDMFDPWMMLSAVAALTKKVRLGPGVSPPVYHSPGRLARIIATLDHISNGRFLMGAGVGWREEEAKCYDLPYYSSFMVRFRIMKESIRLMKKLWTVDGPATFKGKYYKVENAPA
jgi:FMNH2-dependent dimethyl sulfone monooxygenase